ncbi:unnamed protein product [Zymoseptoria tritici ST99CH_1E4]|nr:unnamed protein product [Zymoseptoria tritici ST99CH_1E4]
MILSPSPSLTRNARSASPATSQLSSSAIAPSLAEFFAQPSILRGDNPLLHQTAKTAFLTNAKPASNRQLRSLNMKNHEDLLRLSIVHSSSDIVDLVKAVDAKSTITEETVEVRISEALSLVAVKRGVAREMLKSAWTETGWNGRGRAFDAVVREDRGGGCVERAVDDNRDGEENERCKVEAGSMRRKHAVEKVLAWAEMEAEPGQEVLMMREAAAGRRKASKQALRDQFPGNTGDWLSDSSSSLSDAETEDWMDSPPDRAPYERRLLQESTHAHPVATMKKAAAGTKALHAHKARSLPGRFVSEEEDAALILLNLRDECSKVLRVKKKHGMGEKSHECKVGLSGNQLSR